MSTFKAEERRFKLSKTFVFITSVILDASGALRAGKKYELSIM